MFKCKRVSGICRAVLLAIFFASPAFAGQAGSLQALIKEADTLDWRNNTEQKAEYDALVQNIQSIYRDNPKDKDAFAAMLYAMQAPITPADRKEIYAVLADNHLDHPDLHLLLNMPVHWMTASSQVERLLKGAVRQQADPVNRAIAQTVLASLYLSMADFLASMDELDLSFAAFVDSQLQSLNNMVSGAGAKQKPAVTREIFLSFIDADFIKGYMKQDWRNLRVAADELLSSASGLAGDGKFYRYRITGSGRELIEDVAIAEKISSVRYQIDNVAPGARLPAVQGVVDLNGEAVNFADHKGKVLLLDFWATWCNPCRAAMPHHRELVAHMAGRPFELITLSVDDDAQDVVEYMEDLDGGLPFTNWHIGPEHPVLKQWGIIGYPTIIVVDHNGVVRSRPSVGHKKLATYIEKLVSDAES